MGWGFRCARVTKASKGAQPLAPLYTWDINGGTYVSACEGRINIHVTSKSEQQQQRAAPWSLGSKSPSPDN